jgi:hypothetical protein
LATLDFARLLHYDSLTHLGDLYPRWYGARELVLHHRNPYGSEISAEIQTAYYGRPLDPSDLRNPQSFAYPVYVSLLLLPVIAIPFPLLRWVFGVILCAVACGLVLCALRMTGWRLAPPARTAVVLAIAGSLPALMGILLQQLSLLVAFLLVASVVALSTDRPLLAGTMLALATIKPQMALLPGLWLLFWALFHGRRGRRFISGFAGSLGALVLAGELLLRGWVPQFVHSLFAYAGYSPLFPPLAEKMFGQNLGTALMALLLTVTAAAAVRYRRTEALDPEFACVGALALLTTLIAMPAVGSYIYNHVLLIPALLLVCRIWARLSGLSKAALTAPVLLPFLEVLVARLGYAGAWRFQVLASLLVLPVLLATVMLLRWRALTAPLVSHQTG